MPQYAATATATWAVVEVTATDDQSDAVTVCRPQLAALDDSSFVADELVDSTGPSYDGVSVRTGTSAYAASGDPLYFDDADGPVALSYYLGASDAESGFSKGVLVLRGPGGRTISTGFAVDFDAIGSTTCGPDGLSWGSTDIICDIPVTIPQGTSAGTWVVSELRLVDAAGNVSDFRGLSLAPVTLTRNAVLQATNFAISPTSVDNWTSDQYLTVSMTPEGTEDGIASLDVMTTPGCFASITTDPAVAADGSISASIRMLPGAYVKQCTINGIALVDGAGDLAAYGPAFDGPVLNLVASQVLDVTPPTATAASLNTTTIAQSALPAGITVTADVTSLAGVQEALAGVCGPTGAWVNANSVNYYPGVTSGTVQVTVELPAGLAPGTYTVGFQLIDNGGLATAYGYPAGLGTSAPPPPGGPLQFTVTS